MARGRLTLGLLLAFSALCIAVPSAPGSVLVARGAKDVKLKIAASGKALVQYTRQGKRNYLLAWGALNARAHPTCGKLHGPSCGPPQVQMKHRRIFPSGRAGRRVIHGPNRCRHYDGPALGWQVAACKAPDGSYWALQSWVRIARSHGAIGGATQELRLSHWRGPIENVLVKQTWQKAHGHYYQRLYGQVTYKGKPVYGLRWNGIGVPLDGYGRNMYFDTLNSGYGRGWHRLQGFLSKPIHGQYCYNLAGPHAAAVGDSYRVTAMGTGVTPDVLVGPFPAMPTLDRQVYLQAYQEQLALSRGSKFCHPQPPR